MIDELMQDLNKFMPPGSSKIGASGEIPVTIRADPYALRTTIEICTTGDGWEIVEPEATAKRIAKEFEDAFPELAKETES